LAAPSAFPAAAAVGARRASLAAREGRYDFSKENHGLTVVY
jgi:hypothetical protein